VKKIRVSQTHRKDPLSDLGTLSHIGKIATKNARNRAFKNGASVTVAKSGNIYRLHADGKKELLKKIDKSQQIPRLEDELCQD